MTELIKQLKAMCFLALSICVYTGLYTYSYSADSLNTKTTNQFTLRASRIQTVRWYLDAGNHALALGFAGIAESFYREGLSLQTLSQSERHSLSLQLITSLIAQFSFTKAEGVLKTLEGSTDPQYYLHKSLIAIHMQSFQEARNYLKYITPDQLNAFQLLWYYLARGLVETGQQNVIEAEKYFGQGSLLVQNEFQRAWFESILNQSKVYLKSDDPKLLERLKQDLESSSDNQRYVENERTYAIALFQSGNTQAAINLIEQQIKSTSKDSKQAYEDSLLLLSVLVGPQTLKGQQALEEILRKGTNLIVQRQALTLLMNSLSSTQPKILQDFFDLIINTADSQEHPLLNEILYLKAYTYSLQGNIQAAEDTAKILITRFPGSPLRSDTILLLAYMAVHQIDPRYRMAADYLNRLWIEASDGFERVQLGTLIADCYFLNQDYVQAADVYWSVLKDVVSQTDFDNLFYQYVLSLLENGSISEAQTAIDQIKIEQRLSLQCQFECEWNWMITAKNQGYTFEVNDRLNTLLNQDLQAINLGLYGRFQWLQAYLFYIQNDYSNTLQKVEILNKTLKLLIEEDPNLYHLIKSQALLLSAQAYLKLNEHPHATNLFEKLRNQYSDSAAAKQSYLEEAHYHALQGKLVEAQNIYIKLADTYSQSIYAPIALYEAAMVTILKGQPSDLEQALVLLERINTDYSSHNLVFYARFKQAEVLRMLNKLVPANWVYDNLLQNYSDHIDRPIIELARARCCMLLSSKDNHYQEEALTQLEHLFETTNISPDIRIEAGHTLGYFLEQTENYEHAQTIYWLILERFLMDERFYPFLTSTSRYWIGRTILQLGAILEAHNQLLEARNMYQLIIKYALPGREIIQPKLK